MNACAATISRGGKDTMNKIKTSHAARKFRSGCEPKQKVKGLLLAGLPKRLSKAPNLETMSSKTTNLLRKHAATKISTNVAENTANNDQAHATVHLWLSQDVQRKSDRV
jgi:hypothetical protein